MGNLYIRDRKKWITFCYSVEDLNFQIQNYVPGRDIIIGDIAQFNNAMKQKLLKFLEDNPCISCYSEYEIADPVLISRFVRVIKERLEISTSQSTEEFMKSAKNYPDIRVFVPHITPEVQLSLYKTTDKLTQILLEL